MDKLKFTTLEDIKDFLKTLNYEWNGNIFKCGNSRLATIEDFETFSANILVKDLKTNQNKEMQIAVNDSYFHIVKDNPEIKYDFINHSLAWKTFMIQRKPVKYSKVLYNKTLVEKHQLEKIYTAKINLISKRLEQLTYKKYLTLAELNTTLYNTKAKLSNQNESTNDNNI